MTAINATFDGKVFIPDEPVDLPANTRISLQLDPIEERTPGSHPLTGAQLAKSDAVGGWADREDISDSSVYARQLRERAQRRNFDR